MEHFEKIPVCHFDFKVSPGNPAIQKNGPAKPPFRCKIERNGSSLERITLLFTLHPDLQSVMNSNH